MNQKKELSLSERIIWALGQSTGRQFITALVSTYILVFMTDTFGVPAAAAGVIMVCATIWDAINDPIIGTLADRTHTDLIFCLCRCRSRSWLHCCLPHRTFPQAAK